MSRARKIAVAVGSAKDQICSIGSFARAEARALTAAGHNVVLLEPSSGANHEFLKNIPKDVEVLNLHIPSLHDRRRPWNVLATLLKIRFARPKLSLVITLHELSEAPFHWRIRARLAGILSDGIVVNSDPDLNLAQVWGIKIAKISLGPTLWNDDLLENPDSQLLQRKRTDALDRLRVRFEGSTGFDFRAPWVLHAGLLTGGKGLELLKHWCRENLANHPSSTRFILAGGFGPKNRDHSFAQAMIDSFQTILGNRFIFISEPSDDEYADLLIATDLLILPYDAGVSERRSSFLAACASGANVWTTTSILSDPLHLKNSGVYVCPLPSQSDEQSISHNLSSALEEIVAFGRRDGVLQRRLQNLRWAKDRTWPVRVQRFIEFINSLRAA